jgi:hypothetical protein
MKEKPTMLTTKLRSIIAIGTVSAALASSGIASAATVATQPGTSTVAAAPTTATAPMVEYTILSGIIATLVQPTQP